MIGICYIVDASYEGGAERYVELLAASLDRTRFGVSCLVKRSPGLADWVGRMRRRGMNVIETEMNLPFRPHHAPRILKAIRSLHPEIVHMNVPGPYDAQMGLIAPLARLAGAARVAATEHLPMVERLPKRAFIKRFSSQWVDAVISVCEANVAWLVERQGVAAERITVVHNALPKEYGTSREGTRHAVRSEFGLDGDTAAVCIVGSLIRRKGHRTLIDAMSRLRDRAWHLFVIGDGEERDACEMMIREHRIENRASVLGRREPSEVERLLSGMDLLVLPSEMEAFPYTILEAMACGLPVVASRIYGIPEAAVDGETALLVEPGNCDELAAAIEHLLLDPGRRMRLGLAGRRRFERLFTLDAQARRMETFYSGLLNRSE